MTFTALIHSRGVRYFLLVLSIFVVSFYYFLLFDTQQQQSLRNKQTHLHHLLHQNADIALIDGEKRDWKYAGNNGSLTKLNESSILLGAINSSSDEVMLISTLIARLSSQLQQMGLSFISGSSSSRLLCPIISPKLIGWTNISDAATILEEKDDSFQYDLIKNRVQNGGTYEPIECQSRHKLAIVIPIRNRTEHLAIFSRYMHRFLQRQQLSYAIFVVEQSQGSPFNRGMLMNIGFNEAQHQQQQQQQEKFQCFIFHDVDLLPEHDGNPYTCPEDGKPRLMSYSIDFWNNYKPSPDWHFGGVTALTTNDFQLVNGFSNVYWGWGGEDDDLLRRVKYHNMTVTRSLEDYPSLIHMVRYKSLSHVKAEPNPVRYQLLDQGVHRMTSDGLNDLKYKTIDIQRKLLYTYIRVDIQQDIPAASIAITNSTIAG